MTKLDNGADFWELDCWNPLLSDTFEVCGWINEFGLNWCDNLTSFIWIDSSVSIF